MSKYSSIFVAALLLSTFPEGGREAFALEGNAREKPGLERIGLVTDIRAITPGEPFTVALLIEHLPGYHTYWRGPGIVGVATRFDWSLPPGFTAGEVEWPPPQKVLMAGITAYGYHDRQLLLTRITPPERIADDEITLRARIAWMACSVSCNPGVDDFSLTLPVHRDSAAQEKDAALTAEFEAVRASVPPTAPESWEVTARSPAPDRIELDITLPELSGPAGEEISFFSYDMQVDSDEPQKTDVFAGEKEVRIRLHLVRPEVAPRSPERLAGLLHRPSGWPGLDSPYVEVSVPWPPGTSPHE